MHIARLSETFELRPIPDAMTLPLEDLHPDLKMMVRCVRNHTAAPTYNEAQARNRSDFQADAHLEGGFEAAWPFMPIYFYDKDYRDRKHNKIRIQVEQDEQLRRDRLHMGPLERQIDDVSKERKEAMRKMWKLEAEEEALKEKLLKSQKVG